MKLIISLFVVVFSAPLWAQLEYPKTKVGNEVSTFHGVPVADPYRWLESIQTQEVKDWMEAQSQFATRYLSNSDSRLRIRSLLNELTSATTYGFPVTSATRHVWRESQPGALQQLIRTRATNSTEVTTLIDPNQMSANGAYSVAWFGVDPKGRSIIYRIRTKGTEEIRTYVKTIGDDKTQTEIFNPTRVSGSEGIGWLGDGSGFYYTRESRASESGSDKPSTSYEAIYYHAIGTSAKDDVYVFGGEAYSGWRYSSNVPADGKYIVVRIWKKSGLTKGVLLIRLKNGIADTGNPIFIDAEMTALSKPLGMHNGKLLMLTNSAAKNYRVVEVDPNQPEPQYWRTIIPERESVIDNAVFVAGKISVSYLVDASAALSIFDIDGKLLKIVDLPGVGTLSAIAVNTTNANLLFGYESLNQPRTIYEVDLRTFESTVFERSKTPFDPSKYEVKREFVTGRDGTRIPVFIAHKRGLVLDGSSPLLLIGYGGFNVSMGPEFGIREAAWLEIGGSVAIACVRGGGEYGQRWHEDGSLLNKKNAIHDFVDVAQWLVSSQYTSSKRLATIGASNGGLLVSGALNERPDLFGAVVNRFGLTDMVRSESAKTIFDWTDEYGSVRTEVGFRNLLSYSPLHNIRQTIKYPPVLVMAAELDDRVLPWHQYKYAASLQNSDIGPSPKLLLVSYGTGHVYGKSSTTLLYERTEALTFIAESLGVKVH